MSVLSEGSASILRSDVQENWPVFFNTSQLQASKSAQMHPFTQRMNLPPLGFVQITVRNFSHKSIQFDTFEPGKPTAFRMVLYKLINRIGFYRQIGQNRQKRVEASLFLHEYIRSKRFDYSPLVVCGLRAPTDSLHSTGFLACLPSPSFLARSQSLG